MKSKYPDFKGRNIKEVVIKSKDKEIIKKFLTDVRGSAGDKRTKNINNLIVQIYYVSEIGLDKWDYDVLSSFLAVLNKSKKKESSKNDIKKTLKRFLKFQYDDWNTRFKGLKNPAIKQKDGVNKLKRGKKELFSPEEFEKLINGCDKFMYQALFSLASQTAGRPSEILRLKFSDINFDTSKVRLTRYKTGNVSNILLQHINFLQNHYNNYPYQDVRQDDYIFPSPTNREEHLSNQTATSYLNTIGKKTIGREDLYLYLFRHTTLNSYRKILSPDQYERFADHALEVGMKLYGHNDEEDLDEELMTRVFDKKVLTQEERDELKQLRGQVARLEKGITSQIQEQLDKIFEAKADKFNEELRNQWKNPDWEKLNKQKKVKKSR